MLKRVVRAMLFAAYREHSLPLFNDLRIFTMANINKYMSSLFVYKALGKENQCSILYQMLIITQGLTIKCCYRFLIFGQPTPGRTLSGGGWKSGTPSLQRSGCPLPMIPLSAGRRCFCWESRRFRHIEYQLRFRSPSTLSSLYGHASSLCICVPSSIYWLELLKFLLDRLSIVCPFGRIMVIYNVGSIRYFMFIERRLIFFF